MPFPGVVSLDLTINEDKVQEGALSILEVLRPQWHEQDIVFQSYSGAVTLNTLLGCRHRSDVDSDDAIIIRIFGAGFVDRPVETASMYILGKASCGKPLYAQFNNGLVYGFVAGNCLDPHTVRDEHIGSLVAKEMAKLASIDPAQYGRGLPAEAMAQLNDRESKIFSEMREYLAAVPASFFEEEQTEILKVHLRRPEDLRAEINLIERELTSLDSPIVLNHNDLQLKNIVYDQNTDKCCFIDFEYVAFNYQANDIANHFCEWPGFEDIDFTLYPSKAEQLIWLRHYLTAWKAQQGAAHTTPTDLEIEKLYVQVNKFSLASHLHWGLWSLREARTSTTEFDLLGYAKIRFVEYLRRKEEFMALKIPE